jgi:hypothetical protein
MLERLVDLVRLELAADVKTDTREAQVTIGQLVVRQAETPAA